MFDLDSGNYEYGNAPPLIQILICDYLDRFGCLRLVQPPCDYIRNPEYVQRDDDARKAKEKRVMNRQYTIAVKVKYKIREICHKRFGFCLMSDHYTRFVPDLQQYGEYCMKRWHDDEVPLHEIQEEANRLIDDALRENPSLASLETVGAVMSVSDTCDNTTDKEWSEYFARNPDLFNNK